jgi:hypothetical protein
MLYRYKPENIFLPLINLGGKDILAERNMNLWTKWCNGIFEYHNENGFAVLKTIENL